MSAQRNLKSPGRLSAAKLLPIMGLAAATGLYCGVQQDAQQLPQQPTDNRPQAVATVVLAPAVKVACDTTSLVNAISMANAAGGSHTLNLACGCTYDFTAVNNYWYGPNALPPITSDITIDGGSGGATLQRSGANNMRFFYVAGTLAPAPSAGSLTLRRVRLTGGKAVGGSATGGGGGGLGAGGAIFAQGSVTLDGVTVDHNLAQGGDTAPEMTEGGGSQPFGGGGGGMHGNGNLNGGGGMQGDGHLTGGVSSGGSGVAGTEGGVGSTGGNALLGTNPADGANGAVNIGGKGGGAGVMGGAGGLGSGTAGAAGDGGGGGDGRGAGGGGGGFGGKGGNGAVSMATGGGGGAFGGGGANGSSAISFRSAGGGGGGVGGGGGGPFLDDAGSSGGGGGGFGGGGGSGYSTGGDGGFGGGGGTGGSNAGKGGFAGGGGDGGFGGGGGGLGGGIFMHTGSLTIVNSTIAFNTSRGGTSENVDSVGAGLGAGVFILNTPATVIQSSTLAFNKTSSNGTGVGGALYLLSYGTGGSATAAVTNTLFAGSEDGMGSAGGDVALNLVLGAAAGSAAIDITNSNIIQSPIFKATGTETITGTQVNADPLLDTLDPANGGPTPTIRPKAGSPAIDAGLVSGCVLAAVGNKDQRGAGRPNGKCSIGAFEPDSLKGQGTACAADSECSSQHCVSGFCCGTACGCANTGTCVACSNALTGMPNGTCGTVNVKTYTCRPVPAGPNCDNGPELCDGSTPNCPADTPKPINTPCRPIGPDDSGLCDVQEVCDGSVTACPPDTVKMKNTPCRMAASGKDCDVAEVCDGVTGACPPDVGTTDTSIVCRPAVSARGCDADEKCDGTSPNCPPDVGIKDTNTTCRPASGVCDADEKCDGNKPDCPADLPVPAGTKTCRTAVGLCDKPEMCSGTSMNCPNDGIYQAADMHLCRAKIPGNDCSVDSMCTGSGIGCQTAVAPVNTVCRKTISGVLMCGKCNTSGSCVGTFTTSPDGATCK